MPGRSKSIYACLHAKLGELCRTHNATFTRTSLTLTRVPAKVPHIHQSSGVPVKVPSVCGWPLECVQINCRCLTLKSPKILSLRSPPCLAEESKTSRLKKSKKSLWESLRGSRGGSWPTPQNEPKTSFLETSAGPNRLAF